jgi:hypothetical protein
MEFLFYKVDVAMGLHVVIAMACGASIRLHLLLNADKL